MFIPSIVNLLVAMYKRWILPVLSLLVFWVGVSAIPIQRPAVTSPQPGEVLMGVVNITGTVAELGFQTYEVSFSYDGAGSDNWFLIQQSRDPVKNDLLAVWDTTTIADGVYRIKVAVTLEDGGMDEVIIPDLRVRNYSPAESPTAAAVATTASQAITGTITVEPTREHKPTPSPFPKNPIQINREEIVSGAVRGILLAFVAFLFLGLYLAARNVLRR